MSMPIIRSLRIALLAALPLMLVDASAQRVSLSGIDAKLDQLVSGRFDPDSHVTLSLMAGDGTSCDDNLAYFRIGVDGIVAPDEFVVPAGHSLFITDVSWESFNSQSDRFTNSVLVMSLEAMDPNGDSAATVYHSPKIRITSDLRNGRLGESEAVASGILFGAGRIVCGSATTNQFFANPTETLQASILRGFLVPND